MAKHFLLFALMGLLVTACSSAKVRILPGANGVNKVVSSDREKDDAEEAALKEANKFCERDHKRMYVMKEQKTNYKGSMKEETRNGVRNASKTAMMMGGMDSPLGNLGTAGYSMTNDRDYEAKFFFQCR